MYIAQKASRFADCSLKWLVMRFCGFPANARSVKTGNLNPLVQLTRVPSAAWGMGHYFKFASGCRESA